MPLAGSPCCLGAPGGSALGKAPGRDRGEVRGPRRIAGSDAWEESPDTDMCSAL